MARDLHLVLWDGECGFCRRGVQWFAQRDLEGRLEMVPFQEAPSPPMTPELATECERALYVVHPDGHMTRAGRAILFMLGAVGYPRTARVLGWRPFIWVVELGYWLVARNRHIASRYLFRGDAEGARAERR